MDDTFVLNSQESDLFPMEIKQSVDDPEMQDMIHCVQAQDPFLNSHNDDQQLLTLHTDNCGIINVIETDMVTQALTPSPTCRMLCTEEYPGPYEFEVHINGENSGRNWMFSYDLNKLFIAMNTTIHISFKCNSFMAGLYVRAVPVFCENKDFQDSVNRCLSHRHAGDKENAGIPAHMLDHVIWIDNPDALYEVNETSCRKSVRILLDNPQAGSDWVNIPFKFMCKNSCISGMNRRPIEIIFTLENFQGFVFGRQKMKVRICSCPKRDIKKEEQDTKGPKPGKRLLQPSDNTAATSCKRNRPDTLFQIPVLHEQDYVDGLNFLQGRMKLRLMQEKRGPTEKETALFFKYDQELKILLGHQNSTEDGSS